MQMPGWVSAAAARASRRSRSRCAGSRVQRRRQRLERDGPAEPRVGGQVDAAHAAAAQSRGRSCSAPTTARAQARRPRQQLGAALGDRLRREMRRRASDGRGATAPRARTAASSRRRGRATRASRGRRASSAARTGRARAATAPASSRVAAQLAKQPGARQRPAALQRRRRMPSASAVSSMLRPTK